MSNKQTLKWLYKNHKDLIRPLIFLCILGVILSLSAIFFAFYSKETIDAILNNQENLFIRSAIIISSIMLINVIGTTLNQYLKVYYKAKTERKIRNQLFEALLLKDMQSLKQYHSGELMTHLTSDIDVISDGLIDIIPRFVFYVTRFVGAFILISVIDPLFSLIFLVLGVALLLASRLVSKPMKKRHLAYQQKESSVRSLMQESLENVSIIKSYEVEEKTAAQQWDKQTNVLKAKMRKNNLTILTSTGMHVFFSFGYAFAIIFGAYRLQVGLTVGSLLALIQLVGHIQSPFTGISHLIPQYHHMLASTERLIELDGLEDEATIDKELTHNFKSLTFKDLTFKYDKDDVIHHLNHHVNQGDFVHVIGESGKGKTTLFKLMLALLKPQHGNIVINNELQSYAVSKSTRSLFSYVPQGNLILSGTIRDNLSFYQETNDEALFNSLKIVGLYDDIIKFPNQLETHLGEKGLGLSEGQLQRLSIARALIKDAPILLLDEITSALDQEAEKHILNNLKTMTNKTIIISSHRNLNEDIVNCRIFL